MKQSKMKKGFTLAEGATHVAMQHNNRKLAFTLAEVLITLAVIGIVAAMTIPNLVQSYKKKVVETRLVKFYSTMNQAIKLSEVDNGDFSTWDKMGTTCTFDEETGECKEGTVEATNWYNKYLKNYLKVSKVKSDKVPEADSDRVKCVLYFPDGSAMSFSSTATAFYPVASDYEEYINNPNDRAFSSSNTSGIKNFIFHWYTDNIHSPFDVWDSPSNVSDEEKMANCEKTGGPSGIGAGAYCTYFIKKNGWKIPEDYPFKF